MSFRKLFWFVFSLVLICFSVPSAYSYTPITDDDGDALKWSNGLFEFYVNANALEAGLADSHTSNTDWVRYTNLAAKRWGVTRAGSALQAAYKGSSSRGCSTDGYNVVSAEAFPIKSIKIAQTTYTYSNSSSRFIEADICVNSNKNFSVQADRPSGRYDLRWVLTHEFGHAIGAAHTSMTLMAESASQQSTFVGLWADDMKFARDTYGTAALNVYSRNRGTSWSSEIPVPFGGTYSTVNLPVGASVGKNINSDWKTHAAKVFPTRQAIYFSTTDYGPTSADTWNTPLTVPASVEHPVALASHTFDNYTTGYWPNATDFEGCSGMSQIRTNDEFSSSPPSGSWIYSNNFQDICTNSGVGAAYNPVRDRFVVAYIASGKGSGSRTAGEIYIRTSAQGSYSDFYSASREINTGLYAADAAPQLSCKTTGHCVISYVDASHNAQYNRQVAFTVDSNGIAVMGTSHSNNNWVYDSSFPWTSSSDSYATRLGLNYTASTGDGAHWLYEMQDGDFPVSGSWSYIGERTQLAAKIGYNPVRGHSTIFYTP